MKIAIIFFVAALFACTKNQGVTAQQISNKALTSTDSNTDTNSSIGTSATPTSVPTSLGTNAQTTITTSSETSTQTDNHSGAQEGEVLSLAATSGRHLKVTWRPTSNTSYDRYKIFVAEAGESFNFSTPHLVVRDIQKSTENIGSLKDNTTYFVIVRPSTGLIDSPIVTSLSATTLAFPFPFPEDSTSLQDALESYFKTTVGELAPGEITTLAGKSDDVTYLSDFVPHKSFVRVRSPYDFAFGLNGEVYVNDYAKHQILKIDSNNLVHVLAGTGVPGYNGDEIPASTAQLYSPVGLATDSQGNVYIGEFLGARIRKVTTDGTITTFAGTGASGFSGDGGPATSAQINRPYFLTFSPSGELFFSDYNNNRVRKISTDGTIMTVLGTGSSTYSADGLQATSSAHGSPNGIAFDNEGSFYVSSVDRNRVRKVLSNGLTVTFAGTGAATSTGDEGPATLATLNAPTGIGFNSYGELFVAEKNGNFIRKISTDGIISTFGGTGTSGTSTVGSLVNATSMKPIMVKAVGTDVYVAEYSVGVVRRISSDGVVRHFVGAPPPTGSLDGPASSATFNKPAYMAFDAQKNLYISDMTSNRIRKLSTNGIVSTVAGNGSAAFSGDGGAATSASMNTPTGIVVDSVGNIFFGDYGNHRVRKISTDGTISTVVGTGSAGFNGDNTQASNANVYGPFGLTTSTLGELIFADWGNRRIRKIDSQGNISTIAGSGTSGFSGDEGPATAASLGQVNGIVADKHGNIFITDRSARRIRKISSDGIINSVAGNGDLTTSGDGGPATAAAIGNTTSLAVDDDGTLYFTGKDSNSVRYVLTNGTIQTLAGFEAADFIGDGMAASHSRLYAPWGLVLNSDGNLIVADQFNDKIRIIRLK